MNALKPSSPALNRMDFARLRKPSPLPLRPLEPNRFRPPRGEKQVFLPNFTLTFLRTSKSSPNFASFLTPLWMNKLDLKDYLYNLYGVQALSVRSYVIQSKVQQGKSRSRLPQPRKWYRPASQKKMTVELVQGVPGQGPFVWPAEPEDYTPWGKDQYEKASKEQKEKQERQSPQGNKMWPENTESLARQARQLLDGDTRWKQASETF